MTEYDNRICFGVFELCRDTRELRKHGIRIKLEDQPFAVLLALVEKPGAIVTRPELQARIWPGGTFVDFDKSLTKAVNKIRTALDDSAATPRFIETLSRRGYRFIAPVSPTGPLAPVLPQPTYPVGAIRRRSALWIPTTLGVFLLLGMALVFHARLTDTGALPPIQSLAVLPFENLTGDPAQDYFADGLTDDLISNLARIGPLRVISYTSAMRYKRVPKTLPEIARALQVEAVVEGSLQRSGGRFRINAKLVRAPADRQVWSESYEGEAGAVQRLGGGIALTIAHQVSAHLTAEFLADFASASPRAFDAYLHGRYLWNLRGREPVTQAAAWFEQAVREDPGFALAWSGLADTYTIGWDAKYDPRLGEQYARKAIALAPNLAEAHVSLGFALDCLYHWGEAEKELKRGLDLNPNYVHAHQLYAVFLLTVGRATEALAENDRALRLDPFSLPVNNLRGLIFIALRQYDRAEQQIHVTNQLNTRPAEPHNLSRLYWLEHRAADALAAEREIEIKAAGPEKEDVLRGIAEAEAALAKSGFHAACLRSARLKERPGRTTRWDIPLQYGLLRDKRKVIEWMDRFVARQDYAGVYYLETAPEFDFLRSDPDFRELLSRTGLP